MPVSNEEEATLAGDLDSDLNGRVVSIRGSVVDAVFTERLPEIHEMLTDYFDPVRFGSK